MNLRENVSLKTYNTFGIDAKARYFAEITDINQFVDLANSGVYKELPIFVLGGGSNVLFTKDFKGIIVHSKLEFIDIIQETDSSLTVRVGSGVVWDRFVEWSVNKNLGGVENLSDIPGFVGAAPVQNIGAYGVEAKDVICSVQVYNLKTAELSEISNEACKFSYRWSIFKEKEFENCFITSVDFILSKNPVLNTSYGKIEEELHKYGEKTVKSIRQAIIHIRRSKLPPTEELGSAGSFFKNPVLETSVVEELLHKYPNMPHYFEKEKTKIPAAWLIEKSGLKGMRIGNIGTYPNQPLVIVNYGNATGKEIAEFSELIRKNVSEKFGVFLEPEVCFV
jgi:UDP-N-acetylmuramate dehydrogenase